jgi:acylphosphatase
MVRYTVHFSGHVQGVGFRYTAVHLARQFPVAGYVENLPDGRVLLVAEGEQTDLDAFLAALLDRLDRYIRDHTIDRSPATSQFGPSAPGSLTLRH